MKYVEATWRITFKNDAYCTFDFSYKCPYCHEKVNSSGSADADFANGHVTAEERCPNCGRNITVEFY